MRACMGMYVSTYLYICVYIMCLYVIIFIRICAMYKYINVCIWSCVCVYTYCVFKGLLFYIDTFNLISNYMFI